MKNLIDHDSLHRVEPSARALNETAQKALGDEIATARASQEEQATKNSQTQDANPTSGAEGFNNPENSDQSKQKGKKKKQKQAKRSQFMGGQLFDADA
jgi:hypothetical protein